MQRWLIRQRHAANRLAPRRPDVADAVLDQHLLDFVPPERDEPHVRVTPEMQPQEVLGLVAGPPRSA